MIYQQSVFEPWPIESESIQAVITSPPYYALRKYDIPDVIIGGENLLTCSFCSSIIKINEKTKEMSHVWKGNNETRENLQSEMWCLLCNKNEQSKNSKEKFDLWILWKDKTPTFSFTNMQYFMRGKTCYKRREMEFNNREGGTEQSELEGWDKNNEVGICLYPCPTESSFSWYEKWEKEIHSRASACNGKNIESPPITNGVCSSYKRNHKRQPARKSANSNQQGTQGTSGLSILPQNICNKLTCSQCNKSEFIITDCQHEFVLKDMELGHENRQGKGSNILNQSAESHIGVHGKKVGQQGFCIHCNAWKGQYGLEPCPADYIEHTRLWAKEAWRVLRKDGIMFLNLSDSYNGNKKGNTCQKNKSVNSDSFEKSQDCGIPSKCQLLIPHRVAVSLVDDGWVLRNTIIWYKTNAMPESVTDRFSKKYEYIFMFTKQEKYYFDLDAVREPAKYLEVWSRKGSGANTPYDKNNPRVRYGLTKQELATQRKGSYQDPLHSKPCNPLGKNPGDLWAISTSPSSEKHFAMWPERLVERMVKCSTKAGDMVLDPFCGSATTLKVASQLCREPLGIDLGYHEMSNRRTSKIQKEMFI